MTNKPINNNTDNNFNIPAAPTNPDPLGPALELANLLSGLDPQLIAEALPQTGQPSAAPKPRRSRRARLLLLAAALLVLFSFTSMAFAINTLQQQNQSFYLRLLSPANISQLSLSSQDEDPDAPPDAKRLFAALSSDDIYTQYIAINRLVELYNDPALRQQAADRLQPFLTSPEPKLADAAAYAYDILSGEFQSPRLCHMADGSILFTLFPDYSDYGSHNQLWRLKDGQLSVYVGFNEPYNYITGLLPSPDGHLLAVSLCSNKSGQLIIIDPIDGHFSPELVGSTRNLWPMQLPPADGRRRIAACRMDNETYSDADTLQWLDNTRLQYTASLAYDDKDTPDYYAVDIVDSVCVIYDFSQVSYEFGDYQLSTY